MSYRPGAYADCILHFATPQLFRTGSKAHHIIIASTVDSGRTSVQQL
jgi:hypothetical protein